MLGVGGTLGEAWLRGLLSGLESASGLDFRRCEYLVGSSAGSIVAATLAGGRRPEAGDRAGRAWAVHELEAERDPGLLGRAARGAGRLGAAAASPVMPVALAGAAPAGRALRAAALRAVPQATRTLGRLGEHLDALGARFDGRLRVAAVDRRSGRRVMFGAPGAPPAAVSQAVLASCAVPGIFAPVRIGDRDYVDGGVWSPVNLDAAPAGRGSSVLVPRPDRARGRPRPAARVHAGRRRGRDAGAARARRDGPHDRPRRRLRRRDGRRPDGPAPLGGRARRGLRAGPRARRRLGEDLDRRLGDRAALGDLPDPALAAQLVGHAPVAARVLVVDERAAAWARPRARRCGTRRGRSSAAASARRRTRSPARRRARTTSVALLSWATTGVVRVGRDLQPQRAAGAVAGEPVLPPDAPSSCSQRIVRSIRNSSP